MSEAESDSGLYQISPSWSLVRRAHDGPEEARVEARQELFPHLVALRCVTRKQPGPSQPGRPSGG
jgi:hypothetical protein